MEKSEKREENGSLTLVFSFNSLSSLFSLSLQRLTFANHILQVYTRHVQVTGKESGLYKVHFGRFFKWLDKRETLLLDLWVIFLSSKPSTWFKHSTSFRRWLIYLGLPFFLEFAGWTRFQKQICPWDDGSEAMTVRLHRCQTHWLHGDGTHFWFICWIICSIWSIYPTLSPYFSCLGVSFCRNIT